MRIFFSIFVVLGRISERVRNGNACTKTSSTKWTRHHGRGGCSATRRLLVTHYNVASSLVCLSLFCAPACVTKPRYVGYFCTGGHRNTGSTRTMCSFTRLRNPPEWRVLPLPVSESMALKWKCPSRSSFMNTPALATPHTGKDYIASQGRPSRRNSTICITRNNVHKHIGQKKI